MNPTKLQSRCAFIARELNVEAKAWRGEKAKDLQHTALQVAMAGIKAHDAPLVASAWHDEGIKRLVLAAGLRMRRAIERGELTK